jgi:hypothetical protein
MQCKKATFNQVNQQNYLKEKFAIGWHFAKSITNQLSAKTKHTYIVNTFIKIKHIYYIWNIFIKKSHIFAIILALFAIFVCFLQNSADVVFHITQKKWL